MLRELQIKNVAVIDEVHIEFGEGFNVLTGETGAGKSILIDSINMALGSRTSRDIIRTGCDKAVVSACFEVNNHKVLKKIEEMGVDTEDGIIAINRQLGIDGKSICRINGMIVPAGMAREITGMLIDIHGQNDNQALLLNKNHLAFLDEFGKIEDAHCDYVGKYHIMRAIEKEIKEISVNEDEKARRLELLEYQINEIESAKLKLGEDAELEARREYLYNTESIVSGASEAYSALYAAEEGSAYDLLRRAARSLSNIAQFDEKLSESCERLENVIAETEDVAAELSSCISKTEFSMAELDRIEERLDTISNLKRKYANTIEGILEFGTGAKAEAEKITKSDERLAELEGMLFEARKKVELCAEKLSKLRRAAADELEAKIMAELKDLDMPNVVFAVGMEKENAYTESGCDSIEFLISTNPGESLKPLSKVASGGELSRIMLAIKSILADIGMVDTMIFDEIDTGVSGRAAQKIAEKICRLAAKRQIFSITHLAQIAGMADNHYLIKKSVEDNKTATSVTLLDEKSRCEELARIIGGVTVTELTLKNAQEMLKLAEAKKAESRA